MTNNQLYNDLDHINKFIKGIISEIESRRCSKNAFYFATHYCCTLHSDLNPPEELIFPSYDYLGELFDSLRTGEDIHIEKSRQMLISWAVMIYFLHQLIFVKDIQILVVSSKQTLVDDGGAKSTPQSLLGKIRFCFDRLPAFLTTSPMDGKRILEFRPLFILNRTTGGIIKGESSSPNAGRSGNYAYALIDEAAFIPNSESIFASIRLACKKGIILCSTPNGKGNIHWRIKYGQVDSGFTFLRYHWASHPERDEEWYKNRCMSMTDLQIARELDISYEGTVKGRIYTEFDYAIHVSRYRISYNPSLPLYTAWDFGIGDPTSILFIQTDPKDNLYIIEEYEDSGKDSLFYAEKIVEIVMRWGFERDEAIQLLRRSEHYGDPAGTHRGPRLESWIGDLYGHLKIIIKTKPGIRKIEKINRVKILLRQNRILISPNCTRFIEAIQNYAWETDSSGKIISEKPQHDWTSHCNDSFQEFCINRFPYGLQKIETIRIDI